MTDSEAIMIMESSIYQMNAMLKYRKDEGDEVRIDEYMIPDAMSIILKLAKSKKSSSVIDKAIKKDV